MLNSTIATLHALLRTRAALRRPGVALSARPWKSRRDARAVLIGLVGVAAMTMSTPAQAQVLQDGDLVIAANGLSSQNLYGIFYRLRSGTLTPLFTSGQNGIGFLLPTSVIIDTSGRIVFNSHGCGDNGNSNSILRYDPATGVLSQVVCVPYITNGNVQSGLPQDAISFYGLQGLHASRSLKVSIDDDVSGGMPQVSFVEAYGFSVGVQRSTSQYHPEAFRYIPREDRIERGVSFALLPEIGNQGAIMAMSSGATYYATGSLIGKAGPDLSIDVRAHTEYNGSSITVSANLRVAAKNEIIFGPGGIIDNTLIANGSSACDINGVRITDDNVPFDGTSSFRVLSGIRSMGLLGGELFVTSSSTSAGWPYLFNLVPRGNFLNPYVCQFYTASQFNGPYTFFANPPGLYYGSVQNGRIVGGDDNGGRVWSVTPTGFQLLLSGVVRPRGVAQFPPASPSLSGAALVIRIDSPINVLVTAADGRRIGYDASGTIINDFGDEGTVIPLGPGGHPRIYAVASPIDGDYAIHAVGTGNGAYTIRGYRADTGIGGALAAISGTTTIGAVNSLTVSLSPGLGISIRHRCRADFNNDGTLDFFDYLDFVDAFSSNSPAADFNNDSIVDFFDYLDFVDAFSTGC